MPGRGAAPPSTAAVRPAAVAGRFYPDGAAAAAACDRLFASTSTSAPLALGVMCPHAGWMYSGRLAAATLSAVAVPSRVIVVCPNHTGVGPALALAPPGAWQLPTGAVPIDAELTTSLAAALAPWGGRVDAGAHRDEHAIEVLVPLLQHRQPQLRLTALVVSGGLPAATCAGVGAALADVVRAAGGPARVLLVASSDLNHFEDQAETERRDARALAALVGADPAGLLRVIDDADISMCGARPAAMLLAYAAALTRAPQVEIIGHHTSGDVSGDHDRVVGYAGAVVWPDRSQTP
jgi:AmmeMemoRadiSam system protein B